MLHTDPSFHPKLLSEFHRKQEILPLSFCTEWTNTKEKPWHKLDVTNGPKVLSNQNNALSKSEPLFINISPPKMGQKMSKSAIRFAIRLCIAEAYKASKVGSSQRHSSTFGEEHTLLQIFLGGRSLQSGNLFLDINIHASLKVKHS